MQIERTGVYVLLFCKRVTHRLAFKLIGFKCGQDFAFCETLLEICLACNRFRTICVNSLNPSSLNKKDSIKCLLTWMIFSSKEMGIFLETIERFLKFLSLVFHKDLFISGI